MSDDPEKKAGRTKTVSCPHCGKRVDLLPYGDGWIGSCCGEIVYNDRQLPQKDTR